MMKTARILVVDDDPDFQRIFGTLFKSRGFDVKVLESAQKAYDEIDRRTPDLIIADVDMPEVTGHEFVIQLRKKETYISTIFVSACTSVEDVVKGLDLGADDYLRKPFDPRELLARVSAQLRIQSIREELRNSKKKLEELVDLDDLTGLSNMRSIYKKIETSISRAKRYGRSVGAVMMDLDHFKNVNDTHDHLVGSAVLKRIGRIVRKVIRETDMAARYGGDEFLFVLTETDKKGLLTFAKTIKEKIEKENFEMLSGKRLTASFGASLCTPRKNDEEGLAKELVKDADQALYRAKNNGRNCIEMI